MPYYETVFLARQDISSSQVEALAEKFTGILTENGGRVTKTEYWGLKTLAYKIRKNRKAHYVMFNIDAPAAALHEMERNMRLDDDVLRHLSVKVDELEEGPSVQMQQKAERGGRRGERSDRGDRDRSPREGRPERRPETAEEGAQA